MNNIKRINQYPDALAAELTKDASNRELKLITSKILEGSFEGDDYKQTAIEFIRKASSKRPDIHLCNAIIKCRDHLTIDNWIKEVANSGVLTWHFRVHLISNSYRLTSLPLELLQNNNQDLEKLLVASHKLIPTPILNQLLAHLKRRPQETTRNCIYLIADKEKA